MTNAREELYQLVQKLANARNIPPQVEFRFDLSNDGFVARASVLGCSYSSDQVFASKKLAKEALATSILKQLHYQQALGDATPSPTNTSRFPSVAPQSSQPSQISQTLQSASWQPLGVNDTLQRLHIWIRINATLHLDQRPFTKLLGELVEILHLEAPRFADQVSLQGFGCQLAVGHRIFNTTTPMSTAHDARNTCAKNAVETLIYENCGQVFPLSSNLSPSPPRNKQTEFTTAGKTSTSLMYEIIQRFHWPSPKIDMNEATDRIALKFTCELTLFGDNVPAITVQSPLSISKSEAKQSASASLIRQLENQGYCTILRTNNSI